MTKTRSLDKRILLRLTEKERAQIQADAKVHRVSVNDYARSVLLGYALEEQLESLRKIQTLEDRLERLEHGRAKAK